MVIQPFPDPLQVVKHNLSCKPCAFPREFEIDDYRLFQGAPEIVFRDGDCFELGNRKLIAVHTPGHSPGHCCFYEPEREYLYSGDLIYSGCLDAFYPTTDPQLFMQSVKRVRDLDISRVLPAHHPLSIPVDIIDRIAKAFSDLEGNGKLVQGNGIFDYGDFQIHI